MIRNFNRLVLIVSVATLLLGGIASCSAEPTTPRQQRAATEPSSQSADDAIAANQVVELRRRVGRTVTVVGRVGRAAKSTGSGHQFLNFDGSELSAICFKEDVAKFTDGEPADVYRDQRVELTGKLELYRGKLQIRLTGPDQIRIVKDGDEPGSGSPASGSLPKPIELKRIGTDAWLSPAGLKYAGRDPEGRTRLDHVRRHMRDDPRRDGPHGVFDGEEGVALATIDEAWRLIQAKKIRPQTENGRSAYTVSMGHRVGFLGGTLGASRDHPPLDRVFIVVEADTTNIVTAFPK
ncbi:MAG: hypothetical protein R3C99_27765 [Pirellulaceae bacterium]|nr:hypothetical protein [Planctomycetales bacterium]